MIVVLSVYLKVILQDMELFQNHVVLYGMRNLVPIVLVLDVREPDRNPLILVGVGNTPIEYPSS